MVTVTLGVFCEDDDAVESAEIECEDMDIRESAAASVDIVDRMEQDDGLLLTVRVICEEYEAVILESELNGWSGVEVTNYDVA